MRHTGVSGRASFKQVTDYRRPRGPDTVYFNDRVPQDAATRRATAAGSSYARLNPDRLIRIGAGANPT